MSHFTLAQIAEKVDGKVIGDDSFAITGVANLKTAQANELSFLSDKAYLSSLKECHAGCLFISEEFAEKFAGNVIVVKDPYFAYSIISRLFAPVMRDKSGIAETARISPDATLGEGVSIGHYVVIESGVAIGPNSHIDAGVIIEQDASLGEACTIKANVTIAHGVQLGDRVIVHQNASIGADGFGFANDRGRWSKIEQLGTVRIGNDVDIGANTTIDRGAIDDTVIGDNVIIDNQIQIAHNVQIGEGSALAGASGVAGSAKIGKYCIIGGGTCVNGHIEIADHVHVAGMAMVTKNLTKPGVYASGVVIDEQSAWRKNAVRFRQLDKMAQRISELEKKLASFETEKV